MDAILTQPRGFCAGVTRAIEIVERALEIHGPPVYVLHEIVHNQHVVGDLRGKGAVFVEDIQQIPEGAVTIFSAHGVPLQIVADAAARNLHVIDATCPLVAKVHQQAQRYHRDGYEVIIIGHREHPEVEGTRGQLVDRVHVISTVPEAEALDLHGSERVAYVTQTTLSLDDTREVIEALQARFPDIQGPHLDDICYATQNRQNAVRRLEDEVDVLLVVGAANSSNSNRLCEVGRQVGLAAHRIASAEELQPEWLEGAGRVAVTAGASAPEHLVQQVVERLRQLGVDSVEEMDSEPEYTIFALPPAVRVSAPAPASRGLTIAPRQP